MLGIEVRTVAATTLGALLRCHAPPVGSTIKLLVS
jgi:hypothetical protein